MPNATFGRLGQSPITNFSLCFFLFLPLFVSFYSCRSLPKLVHSNSRTSPQLESNGPTISFVGEFGGIGQSAGQFLHPIDLATDVNGLIYVADMGNNRIQVLSPEGDFQYEFGCQGWQVGEFDGPTDIVVGDQLTLFCTDGGNNRVQTYRVVDSQLQLFSPHYPMKTDTNRLDQPTGISRSPTGEIYVVDQGHHRWLKFDTSGRLLFQCGRYGDGINQFNQPTDVATDRDGNLYIVDSGNGRIKKYDFSGNFIMQWSENLHYPNRIAAYDFIYVTDKQSVKIFTSTGTYVTEIGPFDQPAGVATFEDRYLYVTDLLRNTISVFDLKSVLSNQ